MTDGAAGSSRGEGGPSASQPPTPAGRFSRRHRLQQAGEFRRVMRKGRRASGPHLVVVAARGTSDETRLGLAISRGAGHAPARARMRRLLREAFRSLRGALTPGTDLVVLVRQPWPDATLADVVQELRKLAGQLRLMSRT